MRTPLLKQRLVKKTENNKNEAMQQAQKAITENNLERLKTALEIPEYYEEITEEFFAVFEDQEILDDSSGDRTGHYRKVEVRPAHAEESVEHSSERIITVSDIRTLITNNSELNNPCTEHLSGIIRNEEKRLEDKKKAEEIYEKEKKATAHIQEIGAPLATKIYNATVAIRNSPAYGHRYHGSSDTKQQEIREITKNFLKDLGRISKGLDEELRSIKPDAENLTAEEGSVALDRWRIAAEASIERTQTALAAVKTGFIFLSNSKKLKDDLTKTLNTIHNKFKQATAEPLLNDEPRFQQGPVLGVVVAEPPGYAPSTTESATAESPQKKPPVTNDNDDEWIIVDSEVTEKKPPQVRRGDSVDSLGEPTVPVSPPPSYAEATQAARQSPSPHVSENTTATANSPPSPAQLLTRTGLFSTNATTITTQRPLSGTEKEYAELFLKTAKNQFQVRTTEHGDLRTQLQECRNNMGPKDYERCKATVREKWSEVHRSDTAKELAKQLEKVVVPSNALPTVNEGKEQQEKPPSLTA